jgi:hypothetical protein
MALRDFILHMSKDPHIDYHKRERTSSRRLQNLARIWQQNKNQPQN